MQDSASKKRLIRLDHQME